MKILHNEKARFFLGGVAATLVGLCAIKSGKAKRLAVKGLAASIQVQRKAHETFQNIKEEAVDIVHDADALEKASYQDMNVEDISENETRG